MPARLRYRDNEPAWLTVRKSPPPPAPTCEGVVTRVAHHLLLSGTAHSARHSPREQLACLLCRWKATQDSRRRQIRLRRQNSKRRYAGQQRLPQRPHERIGPSRRTPGT